MLTRIGEQKDPNWASALQRVLESAAAASAPRTDDNQVLVCSLATPFKPDAVLSLANSAAIHDSVSSGTTACIGA